MFQFARPRLNRWGLMTATVVTGVPMILLAHGFLVMDAQHQDAAGWIYLYLALIVVIVGRAVGLLVSWLTRTPTPSKGTSSDRR
jgi:surface polysaccharide O-acyltransferase-like enzyme